MSSGAQIDRIAYRCKQFEEKKKDIASSENQELCGGVLEDFVEETRYTANTGNMAFCRIYDDEQSQGVFDIEGIWFGGMDSRKSTERTVRQRKRNVGHLSVFR